MSTANDKAWNRYLSAKGIVFDKPIYTIDAVELKALTNREPRLLAKFDTPDQLPRPFRDAKYTLLPIRNGQYQLLSGDLFVKIEDCNVLSDFNNKLLFPLVTAGRGSGESQYIDQAFNTGLLGHFLDIDEMYQTIRGREYTGRFSFRFSGMNITVESVQIEVDAGYESLDEVVLLEAKISKPSFFNIRQLYYPYRHFKALASHKRIRNIFLAYDIPSASYGLYEFKFLEQDDPMTACVERCSVYRIAPQVALTIHDLIDVQFQTNNPLVPQADDLNKVFELLLLVESGHNRADDVADYFVFDKRQSSYYREAAEYLGLIRSSRQEGYILTDLGIKVLSEPTESQTRILAKVIVNSWIFVKLIRIAGSRKYFTYDDIDGIIAGVKDSNGIAHYSGTTIQRRRRTIIAWIHWLAQEMGCFSVVRRGIYSLN